MDCDISVEEGGTVASVRAVARGAEGSGPAEAQRTCAAMEKLQQKILMITEQIRVEQEAQDDNVAEYLRLAHNANKQQTFRIKHVFEKKNQKSAQTIAHLHKKTEDYHKTFKEIQQHGLGGQPKDVQQGVKDVVVDVQQGLKDVGANVRAGISGFGGSVVDGVRQGLSELTHDAAASKPKDVASLISNKLGSADTFEEGMEGNSADPPHRASVAVASSLKDGTDDEYSSDCASDSNCAGSEAGGETLGLDRLHGHRHHSSWDALLEGLQETKASQAHMEDAIEDLRSQMQSEYIYVLHCLQEERSRYDLLEGQLNDLTELHQNEMSSFIQELASTEEKVAYQSDERSRESQEAVESCMNRITKLELQQQHQQSERVDNPYARALLGKLINVVLAVMAVVLVFVSTPANFITPLLKTQTRGAATVILLLILFVLWKHWVFLELWLFPD
ncbi:transmembrane and coiled-coil domains protein 2-like [Esox lucius]|uniref:Transmembrane and coiled-coil domain family 2 n=1 Tax=Esox lucius TaxID=8010 RepID=A0A3P8YNI1_ESOLU|nr:transmembrane and coiled-coil domains protein 2-like [Esox lucius]